MYYSNRGFSVKIYGESHSEKIGVIISGIGKGEKIDIKELSAFLSRRKSNSLGTARKEQDVPQILSGIVNGITTGEKIEIAFINNDIKKGDYDEYKTLPRPSTADYPAIVNGEYKSGSGAFSGRMTLPFCAVGGILIQILKRKGIEIFSHILSVGKIKNKPFNAVSPVLSEKEDNAKILSLIKKTKEKGDSLGGIIECAVVGLPVGLGGAMFYGLESEISKTVFAIPSVKGVEFGSGFTGATLKGSKNNDAFTVKDGKVQTVTNNAGGLLGGMTSGMPVILKAAFKPVPSISVSQQSVDLTTMEQKSVAVHGRHDTCAVIRATSIVESAVAMALYPYIPCEKSLENYRKEIDILDNEICSLLQDRLKISEKIGKLKKTTGKGVTDKARETEIVDGLKKNYGDIQDLIEEVYPKIFTESKKRQK